MQTSMAYVLQVGWPAVAAAVAPIGLGWQLMEPAARGGQHDVEVALQVQVPLLSSHGLY